MMTTLSTSATQLSEDSLTINQRFHWHKSAPKKLSGTAPCGDESAGWSVWQSHLAKRRRPQLLSALRHGKRPPVLWGLADARASDSPSADLASRVHRAIAKDGQIRKKRFRQEWVTDWLESVEPDELHLAACLEILSWAHAMPALAQVLPASLWWRLLDQLVSTATSASAFNDADAVRSHLLAGELPLTLAALLPEIAECRVLAQGALRVVSEGIVELLDGEGMPEAENLGAFRALVACWSRVQLTTEQAPGRKLSKPARLQLEWSVRKLLTLCDSRRHQLLTPNTIALDRSTLEGVLDAGGDDDDRQIAARIWPAMRNGAPKTRLGDLPDAATHSEWSGMAVLRPSWKRRQPTIAITFDDPTVRLELEAGGDRLIAGPWSCRPCRGGRQLQMHGEWDVVCWADDDDGIYLELESEWDESVRLQRHVFLARDDTFAFLADSMLNPNGGDISLSSSLSLAKNVRYRAALETREGTLETSRSRAQVLPMTLPEWRTTTHLGSFDHEDARLTLDQSSSGAGLFSALFLDLDSKRFELPLTWRSLTVAEERNIQSSDRAVGYRVQIGRQQWLIYRSLTEPAPRTVLGHNLISEFLCGKFSRDGLVNPLVEVG